jgi:hypothetical protein
LFHRNRALAWAWKNFVFTSPSRTACTLPYCFQNATRSRRDSAGGPGMPGEEATHLQIDSDPPRERQEGISRIYNLSGGKVEHAYTSPTSSTRHRLP